MEPCVWKLEGNGCFRDESACWLLDSQNRIDNLQVKIAKVNRPGERADFRWVAVRVWWVSSAQRCATPDNVDDCSIEVLRLPSGW
jgi:hypothetical protein